VAGQPDAIWNTAWDTGVMRKATTGPDTGSWIGNMMGDTADIMVLPSNPSWAWIMHLPNGSDSNRWRTVDGTTTGWDEDNGVPVGGPAWLGNDRGTIPNLYTSQANVLYKANYNAGCGSSIYVPLTPASNIPRLWVKPIETPCGCNCPFVERSAGLPTNSTVYQVALSDADYHVAYAAMSDASLPIGQRICKTSSQGALTGPNGTSPGWTCMPSTGLPANLIINVIVANPVDANELWLATTKGVYRSTDGSMSWNSWSEGLPAESHVSNIKFVSTNGQRPYYVVASTFGASVWRRELPDPSPPPPPPPTCPSGTLLCCGSCIAKTQGCPIVCGEQ
jgi:hypothetical protein